MAGTGESNGSKEKSPIQWLMEMDDDYLYG